jgi:thioredoxin 1
MLCQSIRHLKAVVVCLGVVTLLAATGCTSANVMLVKDDAQFRNVVLESDKPVVVDFYKGGGCPTCQFIVPILDQLAEEYRDRVTFVRFEYLKVYFATTSDEISKRYHVGLFPTVVLIDKGQEVDRWALDYSIDDYRQALDATLKARQQAPVPVALAPLGRP